MKGKIKRLFLGILGIIITALSVIMIGTSVHVEASQPISTYKITISTSYYLDNKFSQPVEKITPGVETYILVTYNDELDEDSGDSLPDSVTLKWNAKSLAGMYDSWTSITSDDDLCTEYGFTGTSRQKTTQLNNWKASNYFTTNDIASAGATYNCTPGTQFAETMGSIANDITTGGDPVLLFLFKVTFKSTCSTTISLPSVYPDCCFGQMPITGTPSLDFVFDSPTTQTVELSSMSVTGNTTGTTGKQTKSTPTTSESFTLDYTDTTGTLSVTVANNGLVSNVLKGSTDITSTLTLATTTSISLPTLSKGESVTYTITATNSTGLSTSDPYTITITRGYADIAVLTGLTVSGAASSDGSRTATYASCSGFTVGSSGPYTVYYTDQTTGIKFTPTWDSSNGSTVKFDGTTIANSGDTYTLPSSSFSTTSHTLTVTSDKSGGSTKTYTFNLSKKTVDLSVSKVLFYKNDGIGSTTVQATAVSGTNNYTVQIPYSWDSIYFKATLTTSSGNVVAYNPVNNSTQSGVVSKTTYGVTGGSTVSFTVTNSATGDIKTYTITVTRASANSDASMTNTTFTPYVGTTAGTAVSPTLTGYTLSAAGSATPYTKEFDYRTTSAKLAYTLGASTSTVYYDTSLSGSFSNSLPSNGSLTVSTTATTYYIKVVPESGDSDALYYPVKLSANAGSTNTDITLTATKSDGTTSISLSGTGTVSNPWKGSVDYSETSFNFKVVKGSSNLGTLTYASGLKTSGVGSYLSLTASTNYPISMAATYYAETTWVVAVKVVAQDTSYSTTYYLEITRSAASTDCDIDPYTVTNQTGGSSISFTNAGTDAAPNYTSNVTYTFANMPLGVIFAGTIKGKTVTVTATYTKGSATSTSTPFTIACEADLSTDFSAKYVDFTDPLQTQVQVEFYITAQNPSYTKRIIFTIKRVAADTTNTAAIDVTGKIDGVSYPNSSTLPAFDTLVPKTIEGNSTPQTVYTLSITATSTKSVVYYSTDGTNFTITDNSSLDTFVHDFTIASGKVYIRIVPESDYLTGTSGHTSTTPYTITVGYADQRSQNAKIESITSTQLPDYVYDESTALQAAQTVAYSVSKITFKIKMYDANASKAWVGTMSSGIDADGYATITDYPLSEGSQTLTIYGVAENDSYKSTYYKLEITRKSAETEQEITSYKETYGSYSAQINNQYQTSNDIFVNIGTSASSYKFDFTISNMASYVITNTAGSSSGDTSKDYVEASSSTSLWFKVSGISLNSYVLVTVVVTSEKVKLTSGTGNTYKIYIFRAEDTTDITNIQLFSDSAMTTEIVDTSNSVFNYTGSTANSSTNPDSMTISYKTADNAYVSVELDSGTSANATVTSASYFALSNTSSSGNKFTIVVESKYYQLRKSVDSTFNSNIKKYYIKVVRQAADTDATLDTIEAHIDNQSGTVIRDSSTMTATELADTSIPRYTWDKANGGTSIQIEYIGSSAANVTFKVTATKDTSTFTFDGTSHTNASNGYYTFVCAISSSVLSKNITVQPEDTSASALKSYSITIARTTVILDSNGNISSVKATYDGNTDVSQSDGSTVAIKYDSTGAILVAESASATATVTITVKDTSNTTQGTASGTHTASKTVIPAEGEKWTVTISVTPENPSATGQTWTIYVERAQASNETGLKKITVVGTNSSGSTTKYINNPTEGSGVTTNVVEMPFGTTNVSITFEGTDSTVSVPNTTNYTGLHTGKNTYTAATTSQSGATGQYDIIVYVKGDVYNDNLNFRLDVTEKTSMSPEFGMSNQTTYTVKLPYGTNSATTVVEFDNSTWNNNQAYAVSIGTTKFTNSQTTYSSSISSLSSTLTVKVYSLNADGTEDTTNEYSYDIKFEVSAGETGNYLLTITLDGSQPESFVKETEKYYIRYERGTTSVKVSGLTASTGATIKLNNDTISSSTDEKTINLTNGQATDVKIEVKNEIGSSTKTYHFYLIAADDTNGLTDTAGLGIKLLTSKSGTALKDTDDNAIVTYDKDTLNYSGTITYAQTVAGAYLEITAKNANQKLYVNNVNQTLTSLKYSTTLDLTQDNPTIIEIYTMSEYGAIVAQKDPTLANTYKSAIYTITINENPADSDASLKTLVVKDTDGNIKYFDVSTLTTTTGEFVAGTNSSDYTISNLGDDIAAVIITAEPTLSTTKVSGNTGTYGMPSTTSGEQQYQYVPTITTTAEDGTTCIYHITLSRGNVNLNDDTTITLIELYDSNSTKYIGNPGTVATFDASNAGPYTDIEIPYGNQSFTISATKLSSSPCTIYMKAGSSSAEKVESGSKQYTITSDMYGQTITYTVYALSQKGNPGTKYTFEVTFLKGNANSALSLFTWDGTTVTGFDSSVLSTDSPNNMTYTKIYLDDSYTSVEINAVAMDSTSKVSGDIGTVYLVTGSNQIKVYCTPEDGSDPSIYIFTIQRLPKDPYIAELLLANGDLYDSSNDNKVTFDPEVNSYTIRLKYAYTSEILTATVDDLDFSVSGTNSTYSVNSAYSKSFLTTGTIPAGGSLTVTLTAASQSTSGSKPYTFVIKRAGVETTDSSITSIDINGLDSSGSVLDPIDDFTYQPTKIDCGKYEVSNAVTTLEANVIPAQIAVGAKYTLFGDTKLADGDNQFVIVCSSADDSTQSVYTFTITRKPMEWDVDTNATDYTCETNTEKKEYTIAINQDDATKVDWADYIVWDSTKNDVTVDVVSDVKSDSSQVLLKVSDGSQTEYVTLNLTRTTSFFQQIASSIWVWIILLADIVLLICILVAVNRDKYGSVTKKRKEI